MCFYTLSPATLRREPAMAHASHSRYEDCEICGLVLFFVFAFRKLFEFVEASRFCAVIKVTL